MTPEKAQKLLDDEKQRLNERIKKESEMANEYIRIIQNDYSSLRQKREAYNELIKIYPNYSNFTIEQIERMK